MLFQRNCHLLNKEKRTKTIREKQSRPARLVYFFQVDGTFPFFTAEKHRKKLGNVGQDPLLLLEVQLHVHLLVVAVVFDALQEPLIVRRQIVLAGALADDVEVDLGRPAVLLERADELVGAGLHSVPSGPEHHGHLQRPVHPHVLTVGVQLHALLADTQK